MAHDSISSLPCDGDGKCMVCDQKPPAEETLHCKTCATPWHVNCLSLRLNTLADAVSWECPDCSDLNPVSSSDAGGVFQSSGGELVAAIRAIESDKLLTEQEKAKRRQELLSGSSGDGDGDQKKEKMTSNNVLDVVNGNFNCSFCMQLPERPVTTPCGHNFCLKCFQKWVGQGKLTCANCRNPIPRDMASQPRINATLVMAIRMAKMSKTAAGGQPKVYNFVHNQDRPDQAFTTERAKKAGKANACSGKIFVTVPPDYFGPILAENDPQRNQGVLVGEMWADRMECRQWGAHLPHVAGIAGQSYYGAQSVALSGGYEDDEDHGEWFLYTGSGGRDLSGNKRTNKTQSFDQKFEKLNEALRVSCRKGYPVRVVRSHKEKRSSYAPIEKGVRYDGVYRIEICWRKQGIQGFKVCRYLFVRCDNEPAPWTSDEHGDRPRPLPIIKELKDATDITERKGAPSWDYDEQQGRWFWKKTPPASRKQASHGDLVDGDSARNVRRRTKTMSVREKLLKEFSCLICRKVMTLPLTTPCAHNFCKGCLEGAFAGQSFIRQRTCGGARTLRVQKTIMKCPSCSIDISDFLQNPQVNRELMSVIETLQQQSKEIEENESSEDNDGEGDKKEDMNEETDYADEEKIDLIEGNQKYNAFTEETDLSVLNEDKENNYDLKKSSTKSVVQETYSQTEATDDDKKTLQKPDVENRGMQFIPIEQDKIVRTSKRTKAGEGLSSSTLDAGVKTRSKRPKLVACSDSA